MFRSEGFRRLFEMFTSELGDEYLSIVEEHLERLQFRSGVLMSAELGKGTKASSMFFGSRGKSNEAGSTEFRTGSAR